MLLKFRLFAEISSEVVFSLAACNSTLVLGCWMVILLWSVEGALDKNGVGGGTPAAGKENKYYRSF